MPATAASHPASSASIHYAQIRGACGPATPRHATCFALVRSPVRPGVSATGARPYLSNDGASFSGPSEGLAPQQLASAYGYDPTSGGSGQTVAIVDAFDDPNIEGDLGAFDAEYGISPCTQANHCFEKVGQTGSSTSLPAPDTSGWSVEISLDVETVHAVCPNCKILLVEAESTSFNNLGAAVNEAVASGATEVSNSYGGPEGELGPVELADFNHPGIVITAATGDEGYDGWTSVNEDIKPPQRPNLPASLPSVVAVGGTTLRLNEDGTRAFERVWNGNGPGDDSQFIEGASGGGCSTIFTAQPWQQDAPNFANAGCGTKRLDADIAADADPLTGFAIYDSYNCGSACSAYGAGEGWLTIGGTSLSTPLISGLYGLAGGSGNVKYPALSLYGHLGDSSSLFDVTEGANGFCDGEGELECNAIFGGEPPNAFFGVRVDCGASTACNASPGLDGPSGVGTPNGLGAFRALVPTAAIAASGSVEQATAASFSAAASSDPYPGGAIASYAWSWGDGAPDSTGVSPTHTFAKAGVYTVTLTVTDNYGLVSRASTQSITVSEPAALPGPTPGPPSTPPPTLVVAPFHARRPPVPAALLASTALQVSPAGVVSVKISCPVGESACAGTVTLRTLAAATAATSKRTVLVLATGSFAVPGGQMRVVKLHLSRKARTLLTRSRTLRVRATVLAHDTAGATHTTQVVVTLRAAKPAHGKR
jgi:PKD repeat protein